mgnify:CR=1 FL=1
MHPSHGRYCFMTLPRVIHSKPLLISIKYNDHLFNYQILSYLSLFIAILFMVSALGCFKWGKNGQVKLILKANKVNICS